MNQPKREISVPFAPAVLRPPPRTVGSPATAGGVSFGKDGQAPYESSTATFRCIEINNPLNGPPSAVYSTTRRWRAIDVWISTDYFNTLDTDFLTVQVFAVTQGVRSLVASGRTRATTQDVGGVLICSVRQEADRFDVTIGRVGGPAGANSATQQATVTVVASDESDSIADNFIGAITPLPGGPTGFASFFTLARGCPPELLALYGANTVAAGAGSNRYLQVFDGATTPGNGTTALLSVLVPAGETRFIDAAGLGIVTPRGGRRFRTGLVVATSTTPATLTLTGGAELIFNYWFR